MILQRGNTGALKLRGGGLIKKKSKDKLTEKRKRRRVRGDKGYRFDDDELQAEPGPKDENDRVRRDQLFKACTSGDLDKLESVIAEGVDVNVRRRDKETTQLLWSGLHHAAYFGHDAIVRRLLDLGANVNAVSAVRRTPLHLAASLGRQDTCRLLLQAGADVHAMDIAGYTALDAAELCRFGSEEARAVLQEAGALRHGAHALLLEHDRRSSRKSAAERRGVEAGLRDGSLFRAGGDSDEPYEKPVPLRGDKNSSRQNFGGQNFGGGGGRGEVDTGGAAAAEAEAEAAAEAAARRGRRPMWPVGSNIAGMKTRIKPGEEEAEALKRHKSWVEETFGPGADRKRVTRPSRQGIVSEREEGPGRRRRRTKKKFKFYTAEDREVVTKVREAQTMQAREKAALHEVTKALERSHVSTATTASRSGDATREAGNANMDKTGNAGGGGGNSGGKERGGGDKEGRKREKRRGESWSTRV